MPQEKQTSWDDSRRLYSGGIIGFGQWLTIANRKVSKLHFLLYKGGTVTGDVYFKIYRASDSTELWSGYLCDASELGVGVNWHGLAVDPALPLDEEVIIAVHFQGGHAGAFVGVYYDSTGPKADENSVESNDLVNWPERTWDTSYKYDYEPIISSPTVTTNPATSVEASSAVLNGKLDSDGGEDCDCGFEWGETIGYGNTTPTQSRTTGQTFAQTISGLDPKKTYHFRALATNSAGTSHGDDRTFTTLAVAPTVATNPAIDINNISATLKGALTYDGGEACDCVFEYGETDAYGTTTPTQSKETGESFSQPITGLDPNTTYHFRAIATNSGGTSHGADRTFKTLASAPAVTTKPATGLGAVLATLNGTLDNDIGEACECGFEWGLDTDYGVTTPTESKITDEDFSQVIGGLIPNTVYHFRAFATNSFGTGYGDDSTFTTALVISRSFALARREL